MTDRFQLWLRPGGPRSLVEPQGAPAAKVNSGGLSFEDILAGRLSGQVALSEEARREVGRAGLELSPLAMDRLGQVMDALAARGGRQGLIVGETAAYRVDVQARRVDVAIPRGELASQVFVDIDCAAVLP